MASLLAPWLTPGRIFATPAAAYAEALRDGPRLQLGGNIHDHLIALTCGAHGLPLVTLDRRQAEVARNLPGLVVSSLLD